MEMSAGRMNIVVVEDEAVIADHILMTLRTLGFRPWGPAVTLEEARGYVERGPVDLVLVDINLGGKHDGIALGHWLKQQAQVPHVYLTANSDARTLHEAKTTLPMGYLVKPFQRHDLLSAIELARTNWELLRRAVSTSVAETGQEGIRYLKDLRLLFVQHKGEQRRLDLDEIVYLKGAHVYVELMMCTGEVLVVRSTLAAFLELLPMDRFVRIHRSFIANISYAEHFDGKELRAQGHVLPVSRNQRQALQRRFPTLN